MALTADQTNAMNAMVSLLATQHVPAKDIEIVTNALVGAWSLSLADAKTFRSTIHPGQRSFGDA